jgi:hypothetical protein
MARDPQWAGLMMGALAAGLAAEMKPYACTPVRDHAERLDRIHGESSRFAAEAKRARKNAKRAAKHNGASDVR